MLHLAVPMAFMMVTERRQKDETAKTWSPFYLKQQSTWHSLCLHTVKKNKLNISQIWFSFDKEILHLNLTISSFALDLDPVLSKGRCGIADDWLRDKRRSCQLCWWDSWEVEKGARIRNCCVLETPGDSLHARRIEILRRRRRRRRCRSWLWHSDLKFRFWLHWQFWLLLDRWASTCGGRSFFALYRLVKHGLLRLCSFRLGLLCTRRAGSCCIAFHVLPEPWEAHSGCVAVGNFQLRGNQVPVDLVAKY